ncbi:MAG: hypothetical protein N2235_08625, partial [Fischerella sp.]|nr:hypothetical protein [Fischerella sp.]
SRLPSTWETRDQTHQTRRNYQKYSPRPLAPKLPTVHPYWENNDQLCRERGDLQHVWLHRRSQNPGNRQ